MTPDRATRRKRRRIRLAIRRTSALAAAIAFFFAWGTIGAIETDAVSLVEGTVRTFGLLFIGTGFAFVGGAFRIAGYMGDMKVNVLTILQNMVNGAIDIINKFIGLLNKIPGVSIDAVEQVTFATTAKAENEAAKQARADALNKYESDIKAAQAQRDATYSAAKKELADATAALSKTYANAKAEAAQAKSDVGATDWNVDGTNDVGKVDSVGSVGKIDSDVNIADEDLKFLRDVAEMRYVQNFVTLTPTVAVEAQISEKVDVDEVVERIESKLEDEFTAAAEGVYN